MKKSLTILIVEFFVLLVTPVTGYYMLYKNPNIAIELQLLGKNLDSPEEDAIMDMGNGLLVCYSLNGFGPYFPGVTLEQEKSVCSKATEINIWGTSDAIDSIEHGKAIHSAATYAMRYNQYVVNNAY